MDKTIKFLKVLSDKNRIRIIKLLGARKMCVCELAYVLRITQPAVSRHIKRMKDVGLIEDEQDGLWTNYYLVKNAQNTKGFWPWLNQRVKGDKQIEVDVKRLKNADRRTLCCKKYNG